MFWHYFFSTLTITLVFCALFVFYFTYYVGVLRTICFLLSPLRWCFAQYLFSTFTISLVFCAQFFFLLLLLRWCVAHHLFSTFTNTLVFCALFFFYFIYHVGVLRTHCFLLPPLHWCFAHFFFLLSLLLWCFAHYLFSTLTITLVCCALFVSYFNYYVGVLRTICFLL